MASKRIADAAVLSILYPLDTNSSEPGIDRIHLYVSTPSRRRTCRDVIADSGDTCWTPATRADGRNGLPITECHGGLMSRRVRRPLKIRAKISLQRGVDRLDQDQSLIEQTTSPVARRAALNQAADDDLLAIFTS